MAKGAVPVYIESMGGFNALLRDRAIETYMKERDRLAVGVVFDAHEPSDGRWSAVLSHCATSVGVELPEEPPDAGFWTPTTRLGPRFGVWMMPDNRNRGCLETFLHFLVPTSFQLWGYAGEVVDEAIQRGAPLSPERAKDKARIHTWLAWQVEPGRQLHEAVKHRILDVQSTHAQPFVRWFKGLFEM